MCRRLPLPLSIELRRFGKYVSSALLHDEACRILRLVVATLMVRLPPPKRELQLLCHFQRIKPLQALPSFEPWNAVIAASGQSTYHQSWHELSTLGSQKRCSVVLPSVKLPVLVWPCAPIWLYHAC